jgi:hypothetical protein
MNLMKNGNGNIFYILVGNKTDLEELIQVSIIIFIYFSELLHYFI